MGVVGQWGALYPNRNWTMGFALSSTGESASTVRDEWMLTFGHKRGNLRKPRSAVSVCRVFVFSRTYQNDLFGSRLWRFFSSKAVAQGDMSCCSQDTMIRVCLKYGAPKTHGFSHFYINIAIWRYTVTICPSRWWNPSAGPSPSFRP